MLRSIFVLVLFALTGCVNILHEVNDTKPYPIEGSKAALKVDVPVLADEGIAGIHLDTRYVRIHVSSDDSGCPWKKDEKESYLFSVMLEYGMPTKNVEIPVGKEIYFDIDDSINGNHCPLAVRFKPEINKEYVLKIKGNGGLSSPCSAKIEVSESESFVPEKSAKYAGPGGYFWINFEKTEICD